MSTTTAVKERPILFSGPMIQAIREGRKSQTRRAMKHQPELHDDRMRWCPPGAKYNAVADAWIPSCEWNPAVPVMETGAASIVQYCPYGKPGDRLWVRETLVESRGIALYAADREPVAGPDDGYTPWRWQRGVLLSIHMPRTACRILLEITDVRVERLQAISEADAIAEGFDVKTCEGVFRQAAGKAEQKYARWLELEDRSEPDGYWCVDCADAAAKTLKAEVCGWNDYYECDSNQYCNECDSALCVSLSEYGAATVLGLTDSREHIWPCLPAKDGEALSLAELCDGMGDLRDEHHGRLAQIGFATLWDSINGPGSWEANPFVWAVSFRVLEGLAS